MPEIGTSGLMSEDGKRGVAEWPKLPRPSSTLPGCVKTRLGEGCAELFSQLPSSERSCQYNRLPHRRNRDGSSTRKLDIGVFTQLGHQPDMPGRSVHVCSRGK